MVVTLSGTNPAAAATEDFRVTYDSSGLTVNVYRVEISGTVTRIGDQYELSGSVYSYCHREAGPSQEWSLAFGPMPKAGGM
ncbi:hypothetical protein GCM10010344_76820 [Streptomyces bluensis]|nr:hypothetical protein GCM10010344_76820 [Streptomyces bluensis]